MGMRAMAVKLVEERWSNKKGGCARILGRCESAGQARPNIGYVNIPVSVAGLEVNGSAPHR
jgi:hypothetical protein